MERASWNAHEREIGSTVKARKIDWEDKAGGGRAQNTNVQAVGYLFCVHIGQWGRRNGEIRIGTHFAYMSVAAS